MRIAMIGSRGIPARSGGVERVVEELARELSARNHQVLVYGRRDYVGRRTCEVAEVILTGGLGTKHLDTFTHTATAAMDVLRRKVDLVHVHSPGPALWSWLPALAGLPVVFTVHAPDWHRKKWSPLARAALQAGLRCGMSTARAVTAVSKPLAEELAARFDREVHYVPNAVRPVEPLPADRIRRWGLTKDNYVLYVGRIEPEKRLDMLLDAWGQVDTTRRLVIVGDANERPYGRCCRRRAGEGVLFVGPQYGAVLGELYSNAALLVQPSSLEGMSLVLLEAAAYGCCVLASDIPANRLNKDGGGFVYFTGSVIGELAEEIRRLLRDEELRRTLASEARPRVLSELSWPKTAARTLEVYEAALQEER